MSCVATFDLESFIVSVSTTGSGSGTVTSTPTGIDCGPDCSEGYDSGTQVTLAAAPDAGSLFAAWGGDADCADGVVTVDAAVSCVATFDLERFNVSVSKSGSGSGIVTSAPAGIDCGADCSESYDVGTQVTLTATPDTGSLFIAWGGDADCSDGVVTADTDVTCVATFDLESFNLSVSKTGSGVGTVISTPAGIDCGADCDEMYACGTVVTLASTADPGYVFTGWSGDADCSDGVVTIDRAKTCTATFEPAAIFSDGFESGDTGAWSGRVP